MSRIKLNNLLFFIYLVSISLFLQKANSFQLLSKEGEVSELIFQSKEGKSKNEGSPISIKNKNEGVLEIEKISNKEKILEINGLNQINVNTHLKIDAKNIDFKVKDSQFEMEGASQWQLVYLDDFEQNANGWSNTTRSTCGNNKNKFLGGPCVFSKEEIEKIYKDLPEHKMIKITGNFHFFDKWEGESAYMKFNDQKVWKDYYEWCDKLTTWRCRELGINVCGNEYPDRIGVPIEFITVHTDKEFKLSFGTNLKKDACEASWGIDNISVYIK